MARLAIALLSSLAVCSSVESCEPPTMDVVAFASEAEAVSVGYVTGESFPDFEDAVLSRTGELQVPLWGERVVRVALRESLRGAPPLASIVNISVPCGGPTPRIFDRVVVAKSGEGIDWIGDAETYESAFRTYRPQDANAVK